MRIRILSVLVAVLFVAAFFPAVAFSETIPAQSKITNVTIYQNSARVTRTAEIELKAGEQSIVFDDLRPDVDESTLTVAGEGTAAVRVYGAYIKREYLTEAANQRVEDIQKKIVDIDDQITVLRNERKVLDRKERFLDSLNLFAQGQLPKDLVTTMPSAESLTNTYLFLTTNAVDIEKRREELRLNERQLVKDREALQRQLYDVQQGGGEKVKRSIVVDLACDKPGKFSATVSYMVNGAFWRPIYDARTNYEKANVELTLFSVISQNTGEDWENVLLTLSTVNPTLGGRMPKVEPWFLNQQQPRPLRRDRAQNMMMKGMVTQSLQMEAFSADAVATGAALEERSAPAAVQYADVAQKGVSVVYTIARPVTIKSDGVESKFPVTAQTLAAEFKYSSYPRAVAYAYLGSKVTNEKTVQLLAGEVNLFLEGDYVGKSTIDVIGPGQQFDLYLGVDENVKVKREQLTKKMDDVLIGGIPSPNRTVTVEYRLTVENNKTQKSKVVLFEAMPVSQNERIKVKVGNVSEPPKDKDWQNRKGVWRWEFELEPNVKKEITYSFSVEYPRDMPMEDF